MSSMNSGKVSMLRRVPKGELGAFVPVSIVSGRTAFIGRPPATPLKLNMFQICCHLDSSRVIYHTFNHDIRITNMVCNETAIGGIEE